MVAVSVGHSGRSVASFSSSLVMRNAIGPALRHVVPAAAAAQTMTRPAANTDRGRNNIIDFPDVVSWGFSEGGFDDEFSQYSEATSAVEELRELTGDLIAQLAELEKVSSALDFTSASSLGVAPVATPTDKQARKAKREQQRAVRKASPSSAPGTASETAPFTADAAAPGAPASSAAPEMAPATLRHQHTNSKSPSTSSGSTVDSSHAFAAAGPRTGEPSDLEVLEKSWSLPISEPQAADELEDSLDDHGAVQSTVDVASEQPEAEHPESRPIGEDLSLATLSSGLSVSSPNVSDSLALVSILPSARSRNSMPAESSGTAVVSSWGRTRQDRRARNHGRSAVEAASEAAATSTKKQEASEIVRAARPNRTSESSNPISSFMRAATRTLLTLEEEQTLMEDVEDWRFLKRAATELRQALRREPDMEEWASTVKTDPRTLMARLSAGEAARDVMVRANYRLVISIAKKFLRQGREMADLIVVGVTGLYKAVDRFEVTKGFRFSTYATWWIRQAIMRSLTDQGRVMRLPSHIVEQVGRMRALQASLQHSTGHFPSEEELAKAMNLTVEKVAHLMTLVAEVSSLDTPVGGSDEGDSVQDTIVDMRPDAGEHLEQESLAGDLIRMLESLDEREAGIVRMRYGLNPDGNVYTLDAVGRHFNVTRERVRQIETKAIRKLREQAKMSDSIVMEYAGSRVEKEIAARNSRGTKKT